MVAANQAGQAWRDSAVASRNSPQLSSPARRLTIHPHTPPKALFHKFLMYLELGRNICVIFFTDSPV